MMTTLYVTGYAVMALLTFLFFCLIVFDDQSWKNEGPLLTLLALLCSMIWPLIIFGYSCNKLMEFLREKTTKARHKFQNRNKEPKVRFE